MLMFNRIYRTSLYKMKKYFLILAAITIALCSCEKHIEIIEESMATLGITHLSERPIEAISDGERQKTMIAKALAQQTPIILLDEPTAFLDAENKTSVLQALSNLCKGEDSPAVIFSTHDLHEGMKACNRVIALGADGVFRIAARDGAEESVQSIFRQ